MRCYAGGCPIFREQANSPQRHEGTKIIGKLRAFVPLW
jgi:hypothetical protein